MKVVVLGLGYVGCVNAACLAALGHEVTGCDVREPKVSRINAGLAPLFEPGLEEIIKEQVEAGRLRASLPGMKVFEGAEAVLVCVGTPSNRIGDHDLSAIESVTRELTVGTRFSSPVLVYRSTLSLGTMSELADRYLRKWTVLLYPEFLREGSAISDFMNPPLTAVGVRKPGDSQWLLNLHPGVSRIYEMTYGEAELLKLVCNAYHALKIGFSNEIQRLVSHREGISAKRVMEVMAKDTLLNSSAMYLKPGFAFGGSCLPKDLRAINRLAEKDGVKTPILHSVLCSNELHLEHVLDEVRQLEGSVLIYGITMKSATNDMRESPAVELAERLIGQGRDVQIYDPEITVKDLPDHLKRFWSEHAHAKVWVVTKPLRENPRYLEHLIDVSVEGFDAIGRLAALESPASHESHEVKSHERKTAQVQVRAGGGGAAEVGRLSHGGSATAGV